MVSMTTMIIISIVKSSLALSLGYVRYDLKRGCRALVLDHSGHRNHAVLHGSGAALDTEKAGGALHFEKSEEGYSILLAVDRDPATFEADVNLPPEDLPD